MKNLKIGTRVALGFAAVITVVLVLAGYTFLQLGAIESRTTTIVDAAVPSIFRMGNLETRARENNALLYRHILSGDAERMARIEAVMRENLTANAEAVQEYEQFILDARDGELFRAMREARGPYEEVREGVLRLSRELRADDAIALVREQLDPAFDTYMARINELVRYNRDSAFGAGGQARAAVSAANIGISVAITVVILATICIAFFITLSITRPLRGAMDFCRTVADGDLTRAVDDDRKDEIGELNKTMNRMVQKLRAVVGEVGSAAANVASGSEEMSATAQSLSEGATEQASSAEECTSSMEEMSSSIQQNSDNARQTDAIATK
ncbi:MAG: methyl-accepting chemotaxis protein, partial [Opitutales bacterium]